MGLAFTFLVFLVCSVCGIEDAYNGYKLYDIKAKSEKDLRFLKNFEMIEGEKRSLDFFSFHNNVEDTVRLLVKPEEQTYVENLFHQESIDFKVTVENIQEKVNEALEEHKILANRKSELLKFDRYYRHGEINNYLDKLEQELTSNPQVKVKTVGKSFEGRDIKTITITNGDGVAKNSIFIDAGIHAREWIAPATALYIINQLVDPQSDLAKLLNELDFVIQPVVNPDGYEFTFNRYRLWRKTRSTGGSPCLGVDANRNYDIHWHEVGSSNNNCAETYHGLSPFSEKESQISRDIMQELKSNCKFFLTLHSYGNYLLYPWGYSNDLPDNWKDMEDVAQAGAQAMKNATGVKYTVGSTSNTLYLASGSSIDYAHSEAQIPISIVMELGEGGWFGFDLPARDIEKNVKESAIGIYVMSEMVAKKFRI